MNNCFTKWLVKLIIDRGVPKVLEPWGNVHGHQEVVRQEDGGRRESHKGRCRLTGIFTQIFFFHILVIESIFLR